MLDVVDLSKSFGGLKAVSKLDLSVTRNEILGLIGPNGSGKTTTINLLTGVLTPSTGTVVLDGRNLTAQSSSAIAAAGLARTFQNLRLFWDQSVIDNIRVGQTVHCSSLSARLGLFNTRSERKLKDEAREIAAQLGLAERTSCTAGALSYGEKKRLEIARALALRPKVLVLDEPAAGMNPVEIDRLMRIIADIREQGVGIILIEHHMRLVMSVCDRIAVLNFGRKIAEGAPAFIANHPAVVESYLGKAL
jgi:branched-chain amino acid transport system ATP-binding protein